MKQYKYNKYSYKLGLKIKINNNKGINYYYNLNYKRHGIYITVIYFNNIKYISKGFYNKGILYSHWIDNYLEFLFRYYL